MAKYSREELQQAHDNFVKVAQESGRTGDWRPWAELFTEDATYRFHPYDDSDGMVVGRDAIVTAWLEKPDDPDAWEAAYEAWSVDGDRAVGVGTTRYRATADKPERTYYNCFLMRFADDWRCSEFTEYYVRKPGA